MVEPSGVEGCPVYQFVQVTVVGSEWCACGKTDGRVVESVKFVESRLRSHPIDGVTIIKYGQDGHFNKHVFS